MKITIELADLYRDIDRYSCCCHFLIPPVYVNDTVTILNIIYCARNDQSTLQPSRSYGISINVQKKCDRRNNK